jgi:hypothetical protein
MKTTFAICALSAIVLAGCASQPTSAGKHLVYRDAGGHVIRQFDYPSDDFCRRVEAVAAGARCQAAPAPDKMQAQATLRYNPPGMLVHAHYADMARCRSETSQLGSGVEVINACSTQ